MENAIAQALWVGAWPTVPTELVAVKKAPSSKGKGKQGGGGNNQPKWCSEHNTTKHSDAECNKQKELRDKNRKELQRLAANLALLQQLSKPTS